MAARRTARISWPAGSRHCGLALLLTTAATALGCNGAGITTPARSTGRGTDESRPPPDAGPTRIGPGTPPPSGADAGTPPPPPPPPVEPLPATCEEVVFDPCGGDPIGTWAVRLGCVDFEGRSPYPDCPDGRVEVDIDITGTLEIREGNTYSSATDITATTTARVPPACAGGDCSGFGDGARLEGGVCVQMGTDHQTPVDEGVWRFEGGFVVLQTADEATRYQHCVDGDRMTLVSPAPGPTDSRITLVLERDR
ncbi:MAG: hypothetical protein IT379_19070 [Deltaproteobacteria bacterium]|nr:hypothetical protein [Deltaproteobacteria bacterium]